MTDVRNEDGEVIGHKDEAGEPGKEGIPGNGTIHDAHAPGMEEDPFANENFFDNLEVDENRILEMQKGGGEVVEPSNVCESGACMI